MDLGRIHCFLVATRSGEVIYERFYDRLSETDKGEVRAAFQQAANLVRLMEDSDFVGTYRAAHFTFIPVGDVVFYLLGSGEFDELALAEVLRVIITALRDVLGKPPSASVLFEKYARLCLVVDEVINEGILETVDKEAIKKGIKNKAFWE